MPAPRLAVDCPSCNSPGQPSRVVVDHESRESFAIHRCPRCDLQYVADPPAPERIGDYYASARGSAMRSSPGRLFTAMRAVRIRRDLAPLLARVPDRARVVDLGTGDGSVARMLAAQGHMVKAVDVYPADQWSTPEIPYESYDPSERIAPSLVSVDGASPDGVVMRHVLEHVYEPVALLHDLRKAGTSHVMAIVPNVGSRLAGRLGDDWYYWDPPRHLTFFTRDTLRAVADRAGYEVVSLRTYGLDELVSSAHRHLSLSPPERLRPRTTARLLRATRPTGLLAGLSSAASSPFMDSVIQVVLSARVDA